MSPPALRRYRAERLLRKGFSELRAKVLAIVNSQLRSKGITLDHADLEVCYAQAFHGLYATVLGGEEVENPSAWLVLVTFRRAIDESRAAARRKVGGETPGAARHSRFSADRAALDADIAGELDNRVTLRQVFEGLRASLSARECEAASLCYLQGLSRAEAAERMGIGEARMRKLMEGAGPGRPGVAGKVGELLATIKAGSWCEQQSSLMRAYAFGILDPDGVRHGLAVTHCRECPACRAHVASLRGLAAVLPPLPLTLAFAGGSGAMAGTGAGSAVSSSVGTTAGAGSSAGMGTGAGWIGGVGSLGAKLAATGLLMLGTGYAVLGSRAHGSPRSPAHGALLAPSSIAGDALSRALFPARSARVRAPRSNRRPTPARARSARSLRGAHSPAVAAPSEFAPERVHGEASVVHADHPSAVPPAPVSSPGGSSPATGEFGF